MMDSSREAPFHENALSSVSRCVALWGALFGIIGSYLPAPRRPDPGPGGGSVLQLVADPNRFQKLAANLDITGISLVFASPLLHYVCAELNR
jgi:hypothetical protein